MENDKQAIETEVENKKPMAVPAVVGAAQLKLTRRDVIGFIKSELEARLKQKLSEVISEANNLREQADLLEEKADHLLFLQALDLEEVKAVVSNLKKRGFSLVGGHSSHTSGVVVPDYLEEKPSFTAVSLRFEAKLPTLNPKVFVTVEHSQTVFVPYTEEIKHLLREQKGLKEKAASLNSEYYNSTNYYAPDLDQLAQTIFQRLVAKTILSTKAGTELLKLIDEELQNRDEDSRLGDETSQETGDGGGEVLEEI